MKVIALTGGIGCGKSTVSSILSNKHGWPVVDTDRICHQLYDDPPSNLMQDLTERWGKRILDEQGKLLRSEIAKIVFRNEADRIFLNKKFHPLIFDRVKKDVDYFARLGCRVVLLDVPLFFECQWDFQIDCVLSVWAPYPIQYVRLQERGLSNGEIEKRLNSQISADEKMNRSDFAIINGGSLQWLERQVDFFVRCVNEKSI